jgi:hypothetical protein
MVGKFIELSELPFCERSVLPTADGGGVLVIFLRKADVEGGKVRTGISTTGVETEVRTSK